MARTNGMRLAAAGVLRKGLLGASLVGACVLSAFCQPAFALEKARAVPDETRPCPSQGARFVRLPGSATCIRVGGRVTAGMVAAESRDAGVVRPLARGELSIDTRTESDYGPVRTFVRMGSGHP